MFALVAVFTLPAFARRAQRHLSYTYLGKFYSHKNGGEKHHVRLDFGVRRGRTAVLLTDDDYNPGSWNIVTCLENGGSVVADWLANNSNYKFHLYELDCCRMPHYGERPVRRTQVFFPNGS